MGCCKNETCNFQWMKPNAEGQSKIELIRHTFMHLEKALRLTLPAGRETSLVWTNLEQACMWATKAVCIETQETEVAATIPCTQESDSTCCNETCAEPVQA